METFMSADGYAATAMRSSTDTEPRAATSKYPSELEPISPGVKLKTPHLHVPARQALPQGHASGEPPAESGLSVRDQGVAIRSGPWRHRQHPRSPPRSPPRSSVGRFHA